MKIKIGKVGGNVTNTEVHGDLIQAGRDVVQGDKIVTTSTTYHGFQQEADKIQFLAELDNLRAALRLVRSEVEATQAQDRKARLSLSDNLSDKIKALNALEDQVAALPPAQAATPQQTRSVSDCLSTTSTLLDQAKNFGEKAAEISSKLSPVLTPLAALFGVIL